MVDHSENPRSRTLGLRESFRDGRYDRAELSLFDLGIAFYEPRLFQGDESERTERLHQLVDFLTNSGNDFEVRTGAALAPLGGYPSVIEFFGKASPEERRLILEETG